MFGLDITMCFGKECPLKHNCIRYVAKPERFQSYFAEIPYAMESAIVSVITRIIIVNG